MKRICLVFFAAIVCSHLTLFAADPPLEDEEVPKQPTSKQALLEWNRKTLAGDYDRIGSRDPKWDQAAHAALEEFACVRTNPAASSPESFKRIAESVRRAIGAKCNDPLINY